MVGPLIGFGASAWSNTGYYQYINIHNVESYVEMVKRGKAPAIYARRMSRTSRAWRMFSDQLSSTIIRWNNFKQQNLSPPLEAKLMMLLMELLGLAHRISGGYKLTKRGIIEVYKSIMNYVVELPVNATELLTKL